MIIGGAALLISLGQLIVAVLSLRALERSPQPTTTRTELALNKKALRSLLGAATALAVAAAALIRVEASNSNLRNALSRELDERELDALRVDVLSPDISNGLIWIGVLMACLAVFFAQRAWSAWSESEMTATGVALAAILAISAGVVGVFLIGASDPYTAAIHAPGRMWW